MPPELFFLLVGLCSSALPNVCLASSCPAPSRPWHRRFGSECHRSWTVPRVKSTGRNGRGGPGTRTRPASMSQPVNSPPWVHLPWKFSRSVLIRTGTCWKHGFTSQTLQYRYSEGNRWLDLRNSPICGGLFLQRIPPSRQSAFNMFNPICANMLTHFHSVHCSYGQQTRKCTNDQAKKVFPLSAFKHRNIF